MVFISELQKNTLILIDNMINKNKTHEEIKNELYKQNYEFIKEIKNGYMNRTQTKLYKNNQNTFVTLIKRRNGLADWETIKLS